MISIHAPTRGATLISASRLPYHLNFNPRSYKRSDSLSQSFSATLPISIHAPTRGATNLHINCECRIKFQSTLLQEERRAYSLDWIVTNLFQSTLLQEERPRFAPFFPLYIAFQSTLLQEERLELHDVPEWSSIISIHAPTRGATKVFILSVNTLRFQSTLLQEERPVFSVFSFFSPISIHAPTRGATSAHRLININQTISIHAPTRGATQMVHFRMHTRP